MTADAAAVMEDALPQAREVEDPQVVGPALVASALIEEARGDFGLARTRLEEWENAVHDRPYFRTQNLTDAVRIACAAGDVALAERLREGVVTAAERDRLADLTAEAVIAAAKGDAAAALPAYDEAAAGWREFGCVLEQGLATLGGARCRQAAGRTDEASELLENAREVFNRLGARPLQSLVDEALAKRSASTG